MIIAGLSGSNGLDLKLSQALDAELLHIEGKIFPDGETYIRFRGSVSDKTLIIIQTLYPHQDKKLFELLLSVDTAKDLGCKEVITIIPYLAYSRQDRRFLEGEPISIKTLLKLLRSVGVDHLITVDIHKVDSLRFFHGNAINLNPTPLFAKTLQDVVRRPIIIAPDEGALGKARELADLLHDAECVAFKKYRDRVTGKVVHEFLDVDVSSRDVVIVDDIISTGTTVANIASYVRDRGASKIYVACSHALFIGDALSKVRLSGVSKIYALNTVMAPEDVEVIDITPLLLEAIRSLARS